MKPGKLSVALLLTSIVTVVTGLSTSAQEPNLTAANEKSKLETPSATFLQIKTFIKEGEWESAAKLMTDQAADETAAAVVNLAMSVAAIDAPISIPQLDDAKQAVAEALEVHGLDKLDIKVEPAFKLKFGGLDDEEDDDEDQEVEDKPRVNNDKAILAAMDRSGKRWAIVGDISDAISSTPFGMGTLSGAVVSEQVDGDTSTIKVKHDPAEQNQRGGMIHVQGPPRFLTFVKKDSTWKYAGIDAKKTAAAREAFSREIQSGKNSDY